MANETQDLLDRLKQNMAEASMGREKIDAVIGEFAKDVASVTFSLAKFGSNAKVIGGVNIFDLWTVACDIESVYRGKK